MPSNMPSKLKILLGLLGVNILLGIVTAVTGGGGWFGVLISAVIAGLLFKGSNIVRIVVMVFAVLGLVFGAIGMLGLGALLALGAGEALLPLLSLVWGFVVNVFVLYVLTRPEVKAYFGAGEG